MATVLKLRHISFLLVMGRRKRELSKERRELEDLFFCGPGLVESWVPENSQFPAQAVSVIPSAGQQTTPPAFDVGGIRQHVWDPFHILEQTQRLREAGVFPTKRTLQELLTFLQTLDGKNTSWRTEAVLPQFSSQDFRMQLAQVDQQQKKVLNEEFLIGSLCRKYLQKVRLAEQLMPAFTALTSGANLPNKRLRELLKINRSFLSFLHSFRKDPLPFLERKASLLKRMEESESDNRMFLTLLRAEQLRLRTRRALMTAFNSREPLRLVRSLSSFDRRFLFPNRITRQRVKVHWDQRRLEERTSCRLSFIERLLEVQTKGQGLFFFDETSFQLDAAPGHAYGRAGTRPAVRKQHIPAFLHVMMVTCMDSVICFQVSARSTTGPDLEAFLTNFVRLLQRQQEYRLTPAVLVLDNAPKNRTAGIKRLESTGQLNLLYTVPCSPFLNQIENVFNLIKRAVRNRPDIHTW